jgi:hypothetical protein
MPLSILRRSNLLLSSRSSLPHARFDRLDLRRGFLSSRSSGVGFFAWLSSPSAGVRGTSGHVPLTTPGPFRGPHTGETTRAPQSIVTATRFSRAAVRGSFAFRRGHGLAVGPASCPTRTTRDDHDDTRVNSSKETTRAPQPAKGAVARLIDCGARVAFRCQQSEEAPGFPKGCGATHPFGRAEGVGGHAARQGAQSVERENLVGDPAARSGT